ncbi:MAG: ABC transporter substrate-binding protein/permease [Gemmataceae bacterium]|nr:ABC transporter substrate-binding protein/permease [Gemmataceae bacterium]
MDTESQRWRWWALGLAAGLLLFLPQLYAQGPAQNQKPIKWGGDTDGGFPYVFADRIDPEKVIGFEMDLAQALEKEIGRPIVFEQRTYESLLADLGRGDIDVAMNGLEIIPERLKRVAFSRPYYIYQLQLVVRADESRFKNLEEAKAKGMTIGTLGATAAERLLQDQGVSLKTYDDQQGPYDDLRQGALDGVLMDLPIAIYYAAPDKKLQYSQLKPGLKFLGPAFAEGYYGIAVRKDDKELLEQLNRGIDNLLNSGKLKDILQKWQLWTPDQYRLYEPIDVVAGGDDMRFADYLPLLLWGAVVTVLITLASFALAVAIGLFIALLRMYGPAPLRWFGVGYVEFFRGIPVLLLLYFIYYGLPALVPGLKLNAYIAAVLGFGLNYAAYEAEIYRAGISSIPRGQWEAAASLGMSSPMTFRRIILPQAIRVILPPMTSDLVALFKDTSVVSIIAVVELSKQYQILTKSGGGYLQIGLTTAALYLVMSVPLGYLSRYLEHRWGAKH